MYTNAFPLNGTLLECFTNISPMGHQQLFQHFQRSHQYFLQHNRTLSKNSQWVVKFSNSFFVLSTRNTNPIEPTDFLTLSAPEENASFKTFHNKNYYQTKDEFTLQSRPCCITRFESVVPSFFYYNHFMENRISFL